MPPTERLLAAVVLTWIVEWAVVAIALRRVSMADGFGLLLVNAATNPLANAAYNLGRMPPLLVEACVVFVEIPLYYMCIIRRWNVATALALVGNLASALLSVLFSTPLFAASL